jgi:hypothetical protein
MMQHAEQSGRARKLLDISPARLIRDDGVGGSNPLTPTIFINNLAANLGPVQCAWDRFGTASASRRQVYAGLLLHLQKQGVESDAARYRLGALGTAWGPLGSRVATSGPHVIDRGEGDEVFPGDALDHEPALGCFFAQPGDGHSPMWKGNLDSVGEPHGRRPVEDWMRLAHAAVFRHGLRSLRRGSFLGKHVLAYDACRRDAQELIC